MNMTETDIIQWVEFAREQDRDNSVIKNPYGICYQFGIDVVHRDTDNDGYLICADGCKFIIISSRIANKHRQRFIAAHELGHFLMHGESMYCCSNLYDSDIDRLNTFTQEQQANEFASELLLPQRLLKNELPEGSIHFREISRVADMYDVSMTMCARKMVQNSKLGTEALLFYSDNRLLWYTVGNLTDLSIDLRCQYGNYRSLEESFGKIERWTQVTACGRDVELFTPFEGMKMVLISNASILSTRN